MNTELNDALPSTIRERVLELLERPYAGSKGFEHDHQDARYYSNCHGTMAYVFDVQHEAVGKRDCPFHLPPYIMEQLIESCFVPTTGPDIGNLIGFFLKKSSDKPLFLLHTALVVDLGGGIFHQSGSGGIFGFGTIDEKGMEFASSKGKNILVTTYRPIK